MRIGTWNLEHARGAEKNALRAARLAQGSADIWVITETHDALSPGPGYASTPSAPQPNAPAGARWVTVWSTLPRVRTVPTGDPTRTVAAVFDSPLGALLVYGTVLPWHADPGPQGNAPGWSEHHRVVA